MISVVGAKAEQRESETRTLGDLLYGNNTNVRVSEQDWAGLVASIATGDQVALHSLYEQTHRIVFTLIARIINNRESAEELTVDVFYDVWRKASSYDPANGSVVGWIMNQARSRAIDRLRFEHRKKRLNTDGDTRCFAVFLATRISQRTTPDAPSFSRAHGVWNDGNDAVPRWAELRQHGKS
jgi:DNA-directed RNA polymerase specialized sigma24 family protein